MDPHIALTRLLERASDGPLLVLAHNDADGLSSGAILLRSLAGLHRAVSIRLVGRFEDPWSDELRQEASGLNPAGLIVCDLGMRAAPIVEGRPTLVLDHHVPRGQPSDPDTYVSSGYGMSPQPTSSVLAWRATGAPASLAWIAALGAIGDLGEKRAAADFPDLLALATAGQRLSALRAAVTLLNAPRRSSTGDASAAMALLQKVGDAREVTSGVFPETAALEAARAEVAAELAAARRVPPVFAGDVALLRVHSRCQVHPLVAQTWVHRLRGKIVIAANTGFRDGYVHFAARSATGRNLVAFLREHAPPGVGDDGAYGGGHEQASGGALRASQWHALLERLGFGGAAGDGQARSSSVRAGA